jgi:hypothetical protein
VRLQKCVKMRWTIFHCADNVCVASLK